MNKRNPLHSELLSHILGDAGELHKTQSLEALADVMAGFAKKGVDLIAIHGGDGTISQTLSAAVRTYGPDHLPKFALLGGGTMNVTAKNLGRLGSSEARLGRLIQRSTRQEPFSFSRRLSIEVEGQYGFLYADGTACSFLSSYYEEKSSAIGALWFLLRVCFSALWQGRLFKKVVRDQDLSYVRNDRPMQSKSTVFFASTLRKMPLGMPLFRLVPGAFKVFQCLNVLCPPEKILLRLFRVFLPTGEVSNENKCSFTATELTLEVEKGYQYSVDGELFNAKSGPLQVKAGPVVEFVEI